MDTDTPGALESDQTTIHYDGLGGDHPSIPYPLPSYIDFAAGDLGAPFLPTQPCPIAFHCQWLGGRHDGYPLATTLDEYVQLRESGNALYIREQAALIQSQLTFGLLEAVLRIKIPETFLLSQAADGATMFSTARFPVLARDWYHRLRVRHHPDRCQSWLQDVRVNLAEASRRLWADCVDRSTNLFLAAGLRQEVHEDIIRVSCMTGDLLQGALLSSSSECSQNQTALVLHFHQIPDMKPTREQLRAQGWCPFTIALLGTFGPSVLEYARSFSPSMRHTREHGKCTEAACTINNVDPTTYIQRHSADECACAPTIPPLHLVESLLSDGRIPVVTLLDGRLSVLAAGDMPYVAISHVWIDGLGSTTEEGLPTCQISRIASMASSLVPDGALWIDALCVPGQAGLRKRAIQLMAKTYTDAAAVLVIDAGIRSCSTHAPLEEKLLRIHSSGWMQRLWTYQEGMLAKKLFFEFRDGLVDLKSLIPSNEAIFTLPFLGQLVHALLNIHMYRDLLTNDPLRVGEVAQAVRWRTTSRTEDETLALAGLLQIDVRELLNAPSPDERMKSLLLQKGRISPDIIFTTAPKISGIPGFSWAPRSFMTGPQPSWLSEESAICTPTGLLAEYASLIFSEPVELDENTSYVICDTTQSDSSFLQQPILRARDPRREFCNAILIQRGIKTSAGGLWACVGVRIVDVGKGTSGERVQECHYREILFGLEVIEVFEAFRRQRSKTPVIYAKWCSSMKIKVV